MDHSREYNQSAVSFMRRTKSPLQLRLPEEEEENKNLKQPISWILIRPPPATSVRPRPPPSLVDGWRGKQRQQLGQQPNAVLLL